jgi:TetR/AcrR family transcriptional regulator
MPRSKPTSSRRQQILEALVHMLEANPGDRITTASLAREVGVSEAALYRHFPSKFKMFEGLIDFIEVTIFSRVARILHEEESCVPRIERILNLVLSFAERNPGITRILTGDALTGENERLHQRIVQFYQRLETQLRQIIKEAEIKEGVQTISVTATANLMIAATEGRIVQFVRSQFQYRPTERWAEQWQMLSRALAPAPLERELPVRQPLADAE